VLEPLLGCRDIIPRARVGIVEVWAETKSWRDFQVVQQRLLFDTLLEELVDPASPEGRFETGILYEGPSLRSSESLLAKLRNRPVKNTLDQLDV